MDDHWWSIKKKSKPKQESEKENETGIYSNAWRIVKYKPKNTVI